MKTNAKRSPAPKTAPAMDAIDLLNADHEEISLLFADYKRTSSRTKKKSLAADICRALSLHSQIEEEFFYPAYRAVLKDKQLVSECTIEHRGISNLVAQLETLDPEGEAYDAKVKDLSEYVQHHDIEEQNRMFPKARASSMDLVELGIRMTARKASLVAARG